MAGVDGMEELTAVALRVSVMYVYALAMLRLSGKRNIGQLCGPDVVATIIVGDAFDGIFWGNVPLPEGVVGITTIIALHLIFKLAEAHSRTAKRVLDGQPVLVVSNGGFVRDALARERTGDRNVRELLRLGGVDDVGSVREARLEVDGALSVLRHEKHKVAQKRDRERLGRLVQ